MYKIRHFQDTLHDDEIVGILSPMLSTASAGLTLVLIMRRLFTMESVPPRARSDICSARNHDARFGDFVESRMTSKVKDVELWPCRMYTGCSVNRGVKLRLVVGCQG